MMRKYYRKMAKSVSKVDKKKYISDIYRWSYRKLVYEILSTWQVYR